MLEVLVRPVVVVSPSRHWMFSTSRAVAEICLRAIGECRGINGIVRLKMRGVRCSSTSSSTPILNVSPGALYRLCYTFKPILIVAAYSSSRRCTTPTRLTCVFRPHVTLIPFLLCLPPPKIQMAVHGIGSFSEPIVVSDEEDAAFVENELSRYAAHP